MTGLRILVTDGNQRSALSVVRSLGNAGHQVFVCSSSGRSIAGASRFATREAVVPDPLREAEPFVAAVSELIERWSIDVLLPVTDASCLAVLRNRADWADVCLPLPNEHSFRAISDKQLVLETASAQGIATPAQQVLATADAVREMDATLEFPLVVKPARSVCRGSDGRLTKTAVRHVANDGELRAVLAALPPAAYPVLLQRRIEGPGVGVFLLVWDGELFAAFSHRRIREKPPGGGVSVYRESVPLDRQLLDKSVALLESFDWHGVAMVEYKIESATGRAYLMEVNGRFWGSLQLAIDAGVDFPSLLVAVATGDRPPRVTDYRHGVRCRWWWGDCDHLLARLRRSRESLGLDPAAPGRAQAVIEFLKLWRPGDRSEVLRAGDPWPFVRESLAWVKGVLR